MIIFSFFLILIYKDKIENTINRFYRFISFRFHTQAEDGLRLALFIGRLESFDHSIIISPNFMVMRLYFIQIQYSRLFSHRFAQRSNRTASDAMTLGPRAVRSRGQPVLWVSVYQLPAQPYWDIFIPSIQYCVYLV